MADYSDLKCPKCSNRLGLSGVYCMKCLWHTSPAMHMSCPRCKGEWLAYARLPQKDKPKRKKTKDD